jgi:hypothetical protein
MEDLKQIFQVLFSSAPDPDPDPNPDPLDPHVFGPPGSEFGSISQRYGSGSGSFYQQAKIGGKPLIPTVLSLLLDVLSLKNDVNVPSKSNKQKNFFLKFVFCWHLVQVNDENSRIRIQDPLVIGMDPRIRIHTKMS